MRKPLLFLGAMLGLLSHVSADGDPYGNIAERLAGMAPNGRLAVLPLVYVDGRESPGPAITAQALEEQLAGRGKFKLVDPAAQEEALSASAWKNPSDARTEKAQAIGRRLGAAA